MGVNLWLCASIIYAYYYYCYYYYYYCCCCFILSLLGYYVIVSWHCVVVIIKIKFKKKKQISMTSPIVINVPTRVLLAGETKGSFVRQLANLNIKSNLTSMFVNKYLLYNNSYSCQIDENFGPVAFRQPLQSLHFNHSTRYLLKFNNNHLFNYNIS